MLYFFYDILSKFHSYSYEIAVISYIIFEEGLLKLLEILLFLKIHSQIHYIYRLFMWKDRILGSIVLKYSKVYFPFAETCGSCD